MPSVGRVSGGAGERGATTRRAFITAAQGLLGEISRRSVEVHPRVTSLRQTVWVGGAMLESLSGRCRLRWGVGAVGAIVALALCTCACRRESGEMTVAGVAAEGRPAGAKSEEQDRRGAEPTEPSTTELSPFEGALRAGWGAAGVEVAPIVDDGEFYRRIALDLTGSVPSAEEAARFIDDSAEDKRERLVDALLASDDYSRYWAEVYASLLLGQALPTQKKLRAGMVEWLERQISSGRPYDAMVSDLLTATGDFSGGQEAGYLLVRGRQKQVEALAGATARIFLGVQIECAQCHDHPYYDQYKQEDFFRFAAYFGRTQVRQAKKDKKNRSKGEPPVITVKERRRGEVHVPLADGSPGVAVEPGFLGREVEAAEGETRRETLARAIGGSDLLAKAAVNRIWSTMLGRGLVEPWDDLVGENDASHPESLRLLAESFVKSGYDHRALLRQIALSSAYQRSAVGADDQGEAARVFARALVRPLSAYQLFNSLAVATGLGESDRPNYRRMVEEKRERALAQYVFTFVDDEMAEAESFAGNVPQALLLLNGELSNAGVRERAGGTVAAARALAEGEGGEAAAIEALYLSAYGRRPAAEETSAAVDFIRAYGGEERGQGKQAKRAKKARAYEDLLYALLLSSEFVTNH